MTAAAVAVAVQGWQQIVCEQPLLVYASELPLMLTSLRSELYSSSDAEALAAYECVHNNKKAYNHSQETAKKHVYTQLHRTCIRTQRPK